MEKKRLLRSVSDRKLAGVCGGLANYFDVDATVIRLIWILFTVFGGAGILVYLIMWLIVPEE